MRRVFTFDNTYPTRVVVLDIEVALPNGKTCMGAAHKQSNTEYFHEVSIYGDDAPTTETEEGKALYAFAKSIVEAEARYEAETITAQKHRDYARETAATAYAERIEAARKAAEAAAAKADAEDGYLELVRTDEVAVSA